MGSEVINLVEYLAYKVYVQCRVRLDAEQQRVNLCSSEFSAGSSSLYTLASSPNRRSSSLKVTAKSAKSAKWHC